MTNKTIFSISLWDVYQREGREALERGELDSAVERFEAALAKAQSYGDTDPRIATSKRCIAVVRQKQGRLEEAETFYKEAIDLLESELGADSMALVKVFIGYKTLLSEMGRKDELNELLDRIKAIRQKSQESLGTSDIFEEDVPENADEIPMTSEQAMRVQDLVNREEISEKTRTEVETLMRDNPSFKWAHEIQAQLRQEIVRSYQPGFHKEDDE